MGGPYLRTDGTLPFRLDEHFTLDRFDDDNLIVYKHGKERHRKTKKGTPTVDRNARLHFYPTRAAAVVGWARMVSRQDPRHARDIRREAEEVAERLGVELGPFAL